MPRRRNPWLLPALCAVFFAAQLKPSEAQSNQAALMKLVRFLSATQVGGFPARIYRVTDSRRLSMVREVIPAAKGCLSGRSGRRRDRPD